MLAGEIGQRIRDLFSKPHEQASIIAPFIKTNTMDSLLSVLPKGVPVRCVTRWLPLEVSQGVSDLEVLDLLEERGNFTLTLVDNLHAKLYIADDVCLTGSPNVTASGFGDIENGNIEVLVETTLADPGVASTLAMIARVGRSATRELAEELRAIVDSFPNQDFYDVSQVGWLPLSFKPERAYLLYAEHYVYSPDDFAFPTDRIVLQDIYNANLSPGMSETEFNKSIRQKLAEIPPANSLLEGTTDVLLTYKDVYDYISGIDAEGFSDQDLWRAFVSWMVHFYPDRVMPQEISEVALRRARLVV